jgi:hypothetical protein
MDQTICDAIAARRLLMFGYGDSVRLVEPHVYGFNTAGHAALSAWLRPGYSRADPEGGWRMFLLESMHDIGEIPEPFTPQPGYNPDDPHFTQVFCRVQPAPTERTVPLPFTRDTRETRGADEPASPRAPERAAEPSVPHGAAARPGLDHSAPSSGNP